MTQHSKQGTWHSRWVFILMATGSAVGLGNIWKFPYITGENGGGAFVLVYLLCIALVGIPIMMAEVYLGRRGRQNPIDSLRTLALSANASTGWRAIGIMGVVAGLMIMSFYSVIVGWALHYVVSTGAGYFEGATAAQSGDFFAALLANKTALIFWHSIFCVMTFAVVAGGVTKTLAGVAKYMMPFLFLALLLLLIYGIVAGDFAASFHFLFAFNLDALTIDGVLVAMGHAFFTLSIGMGAIMAYGAYMPAQACIGRTILTVGVLDTLVALIAGLAIFSIVFANADMEPSAGPGLLFVSLPVAFGSMPMGFVVGTLFFALVVVAAWSSAVSLIEPAVAWLVENSYWQRVGATALFTSIAWALGFLTVLSFNDLGEFKPLWLLNFNPFEFLDFVTGQIMLPLGGVCIALFVGWIMPWRLVDDELTTLPTVLRKLWIIILRFISPTLVLIIMALKLYETLKPFVLTLM